MFTSCYITVYTHASTPTMKVCRRLLTAEICHFVRRRRRHNVSYRL